jgi:hypothetical protein
VTTLYLEQGYSTRRIANDLGVDRQRVVAILREQDVRLAPRGAGRRRPLKIDSSLNAETLRFLYVDCRFSSVEIGRGLGLSDRFIRSRLKLWGIERRSRGQWNRFDRTEVFPNELQSPYVEQEWSASAVGRELGVSRGIVLRSAHSHGLPVRTGGSSEPSEEYSIVLINALYDDPCVADALARHGVSVVREPGPLWERFPVVVHLSRALLDDLYTHCGLSCFHIELVTGVPVPTILRRLDEVAIAKRGRGGRSPFMRRWRTHQRGTPHESQEMKA